VGGRRLPERGAAHYRGVDVSEPFHFGPQGRATGLEPSRADYSTYLMFDDPDGNTWLVQEIVKRLPGR
jgi:hypothetical protein